AITAGKQTYTHSMKGIVFVALLVTGSVAAQPKFEVASVKQASECTYDHTSGPGQVVLGVPLSPILMTSFKVSKDQIIGPSWLESDCFQVVAKLPQGSTPDQIPEMLQALLSERFKLSAHKESRPSTIYALVVDKGGPKVKEAAENSTF